MPVHITKSKIQNFLSRNTTPLPLSKLPSDDVNCPICSNPYSSPPSTSVHPWIGPDDPEYAVKIIRCGSCRHIFGRHCIERLIRANQPWSHICPVCRKQWFVPPHSTRTELIRDIRRGLDRLAQMPRTERETSAGLEEVERLLTGVEEKLMDRRWI